MLLDIAGSVDHSPDDCLKEVAANRTSRGANYGMAKNSEAVFLRGNCGAVSTDNAGDDLNNEICNRPGHRSPAVVGVRASARNRRLSLAFPFLRENWSAAALRLWRCPREAA